MLSDLKFDRMILMKDRYYKPIEGKGPLNGLMMKLEDHVKRQTEAGKMYLSKSAA